MTPTELGSYVRERLEDKVTDVTVAFDQLTVTVAPQALPTAARLCKDDERLGFDFFDFMSGVDLREEGFAVVTHLYSLAHRHHITLRAVAPGGREHPVLPTLTGIYRGANWHEREAYDMFGITFDGHPGLLPRILTVENFEGWPLRKEFRLSTRDAKPWPGAKEPGEPAAHDGDQASAPASPEDKTAAAQAKAERAKAKAAAMRARKAGDPAARAGAQQATPAEAQAAADAEPAQEDDQAAAAEETGGGDTVGEAAGVAAAAAGEPEPQTPEGAADIARSDIAKDAAAGAVGGDVAAGAPGDRPGVDEPVHDAEQEVAVGEGAPALSSSTPGTEAEGRRTEPTPAYEDAGEEVGPGPRSDGGAAQGPDRTAQDATEGDER